MALKRCISGTLRKLPELLLAAVTTVAFGLLLAGFELGLRRLDPRYLDRQGPTVYSETMRIGVAIIRWRSPPAAPASSCSAIRSPSEPR